MAGSGAETGAGASGGGKCRGLKVRDENGDPSTGRLRGGGRIEAEEKGFGRKRSQFHDRRTDFAPGRDFSGEEGFRSEEDEERKADLKP